MIQSYFNIPAFTYDNTYTNQTIHFKITNQANIDNVLWHFGDGNTSTDLAPVHKYSQPGSYMVKLIEVFSGSSNMDSAQIIIHSGLGVEDNTEHRNIRIYPNPSGGVVTIETTGLLNDITTTVTDVFGRKISEFIIPCSGKGINLTKQDFSAFHKGIYLIWFESSSFNRTEKLIIE